MVMPLNTICKTVHQYNKVPVSEENMQKLLVIAEDYAKVKEYVYQRYGGIRGLSKLYPGYTVQNEMIKTGLREKMELPFVYFNMAVFDALSDLKGQWTRTKRAVLKNVNGNKNLTEEEKHFLRYVLKVSHAFEAVMNRVSVEEMPVDVQKQYGKLVAGLERQKLENYLNRQVRYCHKKLHSTATDGFSMTERAYRYADHGIYITTKEKRKRIFILLTDNNHYDRQIYVKLYPEKGDIELKVPIDVTVKKHANYRNCVGLSVGMRVMLVTDEGNRYGEQLDVYQEKYTSWIQEQTIKHSMNREYDKGRMKYQAKKKRMEEQLHSYINMELNRFLCVEQPRIVFFPKVSNQKVAGKNKKMKYAMTMWQRGYIRNRLIQKCRENAVEIVEVPGKDISKVCSQCGAYGLKKEGLFLCLNCGYQVDEKQNAAQNVKKRGQEMEIIRMDAQINKEIGF